MNKNQYEFSKMFFEDIDWEDRIPKKVSGDNFEYLNDEEMQIFLDMYYKENLKNDLRSKKIKTIENKNG